MKAYCTISNKTGSVYETPVPPATSTDVSYFPRSGDGPYGPSTNTLTGFPSSADSLRRLVNPPRAWMRKTSSFQYGALAPSSGSFSVAPSLSSGDSMLAIVKGCASNGIADTPGRMRYAVCPGLQWKCAGRRMRRRMKCSERSSVVASIVPEPEPKPKYEWLNATRRTMRTKRSSAQMRIAGQMKYESLPGLLALLLVSGSWTYSIFDVWTYAPASMILGDGR